VLDNAGGLGLKSRFDRLAETPHVDGVMGPGFTRRATAVRSSDAHGTRERANYAEAARRLRAALVLRFAHDAGLPADTHAAYGEAQATTAHEPAW
jgi:hypothetical protein